jgi:hypothetical protein
VTLDKRKKEDKNSNIVEELILEFIWNEKKNLSR